MYRNQNKPGFSNASPDRKKSSCGMDLCVNTKAIGPNQLLVVTDQLKFLLDF